MKFLRVIEEMQVFLIRKVRIKRLNSFVNFISQNSHWVLFLKISLRLEDITIAQYNHQFRIINVWRKKKSKISYCRNVILMESRVIILFPWIILKILKSQETRTHPERRDMAKIKQSDINLLNLKKTKV